MMMKHSKITRYHFSKRGEFRCSICGGLISINPFKNGYICDSCLQYVKTI